MGHSSPPKYTIWQGLEETIFLAVRHTLLPLSTPQDYEALLAKYDHNNYSKLSEFIEFIPEERKEQFKSIISEGHLITRSALQAVLDSVARSVSTAEVMRRASWLYLSGFPREVQSVLEDLPFEGPKLFAAKTDESLHMLKESRATLRSLGFYMPGTKKRQGK